MSLKSAIMYSLVGISVSSVAFYPFLTHLKKDKLDHLLTVANLTVISVGFGCFYYGYALK